MYYVLCMVKNMSFLHCCFFFLSWKMVVVVEIQFICLIFMVTGGWYTRGWLGTLTTVTKKHKNEEEVKFNRINFTTTF